jgi:hypothetical protein
MTLEPPRIVECHRGDVGARMRRILLIGPSVLTVGGIVIAASFITHQPRALRVDATLLGLLLVAGGALTTIVGMQRLLTEDVSLALRTDGLTLQSSGHESLVTWDEIERAGWDPVRGELVIERTGAPPIAISRTFAGIDGPTLAARIVATKRRAAMNLLR